MSLKEQKLVVRHVFQKFMGDGDLTAYDDLIAEDAIGHCPESWKKVHATEVYGRKNTKNHDVEYRNAFLFKDITIHEMAAINDKVFVHWATKGIHRGAFYGFRATNRPFSVSGQTLYRFNKDVQIAEVWQSWDMHGLLNQIGWHRSTKNNDNINHKFLAKQASQLTEREKTCLKYLIMGKTAKETADILSMSTRTIEHYFENIKNKLICTSKRELFSIARSMESADIL